MKRILSIIPALALAAAILTGCNEENAINPSDIPSFDRFEFPQGSNSYDAVFEQIEKEHSVIFLYKDFTDFDLTRTWEGNTSTPTLDYEFFSHEELTVLAPWLKSNFLDPLGTDLTQGLFKRYIYLTKGYQTQYWLTPEYSYWVKSNLIMNGMDYWMMSPDVDSFMPVENPSMSDSTKSVWPVVNLFGILLEGAYKAGHITLPADFDDGIIFDTRTYTYNDQATNYKDFWGRRGVLFSSSGNFGISNTGGFVEASATGNDKQFIRFVNAAMYIRDLWSQFEQDNYWEDCPLLKSRFEKLIDHFKKEYKIDLREYGRKAWSAIMTNPGDYVL